LSGLQASYENRIQILESRLLNSEQQGITVEKKSDAVSSFMNDVIEKLESKVLNLE
jgi:hypothetical protein